MLMVLPKAVNKGRMGKKHSTSKPGGGRTNAIFKIAGANFKEKKSNNKPKEVTSKLKTISMKNKTKVEELDATLVLMQKKSASDGVSVAGGVAASHLPPVERKMQVGEEQMDQLADSLVSST